MIRAALIPLAFVACSASAQSICRIYEYAELRDMKQEQLEQMSCDYYKQMMGMVKVALAELQAGRTSSSNRAQNDAGRCSQELERIERALEAKYSAKRPACPTP